MSSAKLVNFLVTPEKFCRCQNIQNVKISRITLVSIFQLFNLHNNLGRRSPKYYLCQITFKSAEEMNSINFKASVKVVRCILVQLCIIYRNKIKFKLNQLNNFSQVDFLKFKGRSVLHKNIHHSKKLRQCSNGKQLH